MENSLCISPCDVKGQTKGPIQWKGINLIKKPYFILKLIFDDGNNSKFNNFCSVNPKIVKWTLCIPLHWRLLMVPK